MSNKNNISILEPERCTGCGVCDNSCPVNAITMVSDDEGFRVPFVDEGKCINCKLCVKSCPALSLKKDNKIKPDMYAVRADDKIRAVSSSGGVFSLIAEYIFSKGGYVCGAAFDKDMKLKHVMVSSMDELPKLRGSKYLQSDTVDIYNKVKKALSDNKPVLFVGTPCQVAGLNNYIGKNDNLFTADILCHGVPSQQVFDKFLDELPEGAGRAGKKKSIENIDFRNKRHGWNAEHIIVSYSDGTEYDKSMREGNLYVKAFLSNMILRESCEHCPFSNFPRHGDISMGDFWGIASYDKSQNDGKGTSIVFVNNLKGKQLFDTAIKPKSITKQFDFFENMPNRIRSYFKANPRRGKLLKLLKNHSFAEAMQLTLQEKFDVGLVSNFYAVNFGGSLTQYALYNVLEDMGFSTLMIERPKSAKGIIPEKVREICYEKWPYPEYALAKQYPTKDDMRELNKHCNSFVVGSDQLFQNSLFNALGGIYTLDWVANTKRKIAYAASFGYDHVWGEPEQLAEMGYFMQQFDAFSVREDSGVNVAKHYFGVEAVQVLDPVFLVDHKHYNELISHSARKIEDNYISSYILDPSEDKVEMLRTLNKSLGLRVEVFSELGNKDSDKFAEFGVTKLKVEGRLQSIKHASFFLCDSFHGTCLAIIYNVPFISVVNKQRGGARFGSLLRYFGLEDRMVESLEEFKSKPELLKPIDFSYANKRLKAGREFGLKWLRSALLKEPKKGASIYDILMSRLAERDKEIQFLRKRVECLYRDRNTLPVADNIEDYLKALKANQSSCIYVVAVKDTPGLSVTEELAHKLSECLGITENMVGRHWKSYAAVVDGGKLIFEKLSDKKIEKSLKLGDFGIRIESAALNVGNMAQIIVNGTDYAVNRRGFNIVAIDKTDGYVCDSVRLDFHLKSYVFERKNI